MITRKSSGKTNGYREVQMTRSRLTNARIIKAAFRGNAPVLVLLMPRRLESEATKLINFL